MVKISFVITRYHFAINRRKQINEWMQLKSHIMNLSKFGYSDYFNLQEDCGSFNFFVGFL